MSLRKRKPAGGDSESLVAPAAIAATLAAASSAASDSAVASSFPAPVIGGTSSASSTASHFKTPLKMPAKLTSSKTPLKTASASKTPKTTVTNAKPTKPVTELTRPKTVAAPTAITKTPSETKEKTETARMSPAMSEQANISANVNYNRGHMDVIAEGAPVPPGGKHKRLDPNKSPGMPLDNKDSLCGRLIHYAVGGTNPKTMSGTFVPGIRMDGATEGEYPPGLFAQNGRALKAFVNCFAGYFNTMGGSIPPCPDCPPKSLNLNGNSNSSNKANPLKKSAYEYPWSIRAGFLPERIEALELMEDPKPNKNKLAKQQRVAEFKPASIPSAAPTPQCNIVDSSPAAPLVNASPTPSQPSVEANANANALVTRSSTSRREPAAKASAAAGGKEETTAPPARKKSLWRELQQQRQLEQLQQQGQCGNTNQNCDHQERRSSIDLTRPPSLTSRLEGATNLIQQYRGQIDARLSKTKLTTAVCDLPHIQQELQLRRNHSDTSNLSGPTVFPLRYNGVSSSMTLDQGTFSPSINPSFGARARDWVPAAASGML